MVDFTVPEAAMGNIRTALAANVIPIVGTTGLTPDDLGEIRSLCESTGTAALVAPNFASRTRRWRRYSSSWPR